MTTGQQDAPLWSDKNIADDARRASSNASIQAIVRSSLLFMRHGYEAKLKAERATLTARVAELEAELELAEGMLQQTRMESNMIFDRGAQRLARIKELEAELAQAQAGRCTPCDIDTKSNLITRAQFRGITEQGYRLCRWQEGSES